MFWAVPPRITPFSFGDDIQEGMRVQVMCTSSQGDQPFNISWYRDGKRLTSHQPQQKLNTVDEMGDKTIEINEIQSFSSILTIHNITSHHNGKYTCQISNAAGSVELSNVLSVAGNYDSLVLNIVLHQQVFFFLFFAHKSTLAEHSLFFSSKLHHQGFSSHTANSSYSLLSVIFL